MKTKTFLHKFPVLKTGIKRGKLHKIVVTPMKFGSIVENYTIEQCATVEAYEQWEYGLLVNTWCDEEGKVVFEEFDRVLYEKLIYDPLEDKELLT